MIRNDHGAQERPALLLVTRDSGRRADLDAALTAADWQVRLSDRGAEADLTGADAWSLILLDLDGETAHETQIAGLIRTSSGSASAAPILVVQPDPGTSAEPAGVDAVLKGVGSGETLARALETWRPVSLEPTRRIAAMFGAGPIAGMIERLALRLEAAIATLDRGVIDKGEAHRLAGLCGTLGFGQAHAAWLDLSVGDESAVPDVRRTTRLTLAAIARGL
jgi:hypothetical protein